MAYKATIGVMINLFKKFLGSNEEAPSNQPKKPIQKPDTVLIPKAPKPSPNPASGEDQRGEMVSLSLSFVFKNLPQELKPLVIKQPNPQGVFSCPKKQLLSQLAGGSFRMVFRDLKKCIPPGHFNEVQDLDQIEINLPLQGIIQQVGTDLFSLRSGQKQIEVPDDVGPVFGERGGLAVPGPGKEKPAVPDRPQSLPKPESTAQTTPSALGKVPAPEIKTPEQPAVAPEVKIKMPQAPTSVAPRVSQSPITPISPDPTPTELEVKPAPGQAAGPILELAVDQVATQWPEKLKSALKASPPASGMLSLPMSLVEPGMKRGRIALAWEEIRPHLPRGIPTDTLGSQETVELPLAVVAPLFLKRYTTQTPQKSVEVDQSIPGLFENLAKPGVKPDPKPESSASGGVEIATPSAVPVEKSEQGGIQPSEPSKQTTPQPSPYGKFFNDPERTDWTTSDIVTYLTIWPGISSAMIASTDGLVISELTEEGLKAENIVALAVQSYKHLGKLRQELRQTQKIGISISIGSMQLWIREAGDSYLIVAGAIGSKMDNQKLESLANLLAQHPI